jgi:hypothetical protein
MQDIWYDHNISVQDIIDLCGGNTAYNITHEKDQFFYDITYNKVKFHASIRIMYFIKFCLLMLKSRRKRKYMELFLIEEGYILQSETIQTKRWY